MVVSCWPGSGFDHTSLGKVGSKLIEYGLALHPALINKSINLGTTNAKRIDPALKVGSCDIISPRQCLTCLKKVVEL